MTHQERNNLASLISTILVFGYYFWHVFGMSRAGEFDGADGASLVGKSVLLLILASIVVNIIMHILMEIAFAIVTRDPEPSFVVDERDKLIELRALKVSHYVLGTGFLIAMAALAFGRSPFTILFMMVFFFALSSVVENLMQLFLYRRGY